MNIHEARRQAAERLDACMKTNERLVEPDEDEEVFLMWLDKQKLRGIPALGPGVSGHIAGSDPLEALLDKYPEEDVA